jgi:hypothetical protein
MIQDIMEGLNTIIKKQFKDIFKIDFYFDPDLDTLAWLRRDKYYLPSSKQLQIGLDMDKTYTEDIVVSYNRTPITLNKNYFPSGMSSKNIKLGTQRLNEANTFTERSAFPVEFDITYSFLIMNHKTTDLFEILYLDKLLGNIKFQLTYEYEDSDEPIILDYIATFNPIEDIQQLNYKENGAIRQVIITTNIKGFVLSPITITQKKVKKLILNILNLRGNKPSEDDILLFTKTYDYIKEF